MRTAFHVGVTGLMANQEAMDTIGHNLANANTVGFQPKQYSFEALLRDEMYVNSELDPQKGNGVKSVDKGIKVGAGGLQQTGNQLDFATNQNGFFAVEYDGETHYTKDGTFIISLYNNQPHLATDDGGFVLDENNAPIIIGRNAQNEYDYDILPSQIAVYEFMNPAALTPISNNSFVPNELSGDPEAIVGGDKETLSGFIEMSGTSVVDEMVNMIEAQRLFQISARVIQTADENETTINSLRR